MLKFFRKTLVDRITSQEIQESEYTNVRVLSASSITLNGANQPLVVVPVPSGAELLITGAYMYAGALTTFTISYTQTLPTGTDTQTVYYVLESAGSISDTKNIKESGPVLAMVNGTTSAVTVTMAVVSATTGTQYTGDIWYILR